MGSLRVKWRENSEVVEVVTVVEISRVVRY